MISIHQAASPHDDESTKLSNQPTNQPTNQPSPFLILCVCLHCFVVLLFVFAFAFTFLCALASSVLLVPFSSSVLVRPRCRAVHQGGARAHGNTQAHSTARGKVLGTTGVIGRQRRTASSSVGEKKKNGTSEGGSANADASQERNVVQLQLAGVKHNATPHLHTYILHTLGVAFIIICTPLNTLFLSCWNEQYVLTCQ